MEAAKTSVSEIRRCIARGEFETARSLLDRCADAGPLTPDLLVLGSDLLVQSGDANRAEAALRTAINAAPDTPGAWIRLLRLLLRRRSIAEAQQIFRERIWGSSVAQDIQDRLVIQLTSGVGVNADAALAFLEQLDDGQATRPVVLVRKAVFLSRRMDDDAALKALNQANATEPLPSYATVLRAELLLKSGEAPAALEVTRQMVAAEPDNARHAEKLVSAAAMSGDMDQARDALRSALLRHPTDPSLILRFNRVPLAPDDAAALFEIIVGNAAGQELEPRALLQYAQACLEQNRFDEARSILSRIEGDVTVAHMARPLAGALEFMAAAGPLPPSRIEEDRRSGVTTALCPGADTMLVVFAGLMGRFGYLPLSMLDRLLARYRTHVVYLRDTSEAAYLKGVRGLGASEDEAVAQLREMASNLGATRILTMGGSLGGFAATRFGVKIRADAVLSLAGPTRLEPGVSRRETPQHVRRSLGRVSRPIDVLDELRAASGLELYYVYGAERDSHCRHAEVLKEVPGVFLRPLPSDSALTAMDMMARGMLFELLSNDLQLKLGQ